MASNPADRRSLLRPEGSDLSDTPTAIGSSSPPHQRHNYRQMGSQGSADFIDPSPRYSSPIPTVNAFEPLDQSVRGLGISDRRQSVQSIQRVPVGSRTPLSPPGPSTPFTPSTSAKDSPHTGSTPGSSNPLLYPAWPLQES